MQYVDVMKRIQRIRLRTNKMLCGVGIGSFATRRIGDGFEFEQLRDYQVGDNVRAIDWKSSARHNKLIVRSYREDQNRSILLLIDISSSTKFGSASLLAESVIKDVGIMLCCMAENGRDRIGALFFHDTIAQVVPFGVGRLHSAMLAQAICAAQATGKGTSIDQVYAAVLERCKKNTCVVLISDCLGEGYEKLMTLVAKRHELMVLRVYDGIVRDFPHQLLVACQDPETGLTVDCTDPASMAAMRAFMAQWYQRQTILFRKSGIRYCDLNVRESYEKVLVPFFTQSCL